MANWTVQEIMDMVQELVGEPAGSYYNLSTRLKMLNSAQREMVRLVRAFRDTHDESITAGTAAYTYPADFFDFSKEQPYLTDSASTSYKLDVVDVDYMDRRFPGWRDSGTTDNRGTPKYMVMLDRENYQLYPVPDATYTLTIPHNIVPTELTDLDDTVFENVNLLDEWAPGLAYKVAATYMLPRAPQLAQQYQNMYEDTIKEMRWAMRTNPQHHLTIRPTGYER